MIRLLCQLEAERRKLNEMGEQSLAQGIPLPENEAVQAQSRKVDECIARVHHMEASRERHLR